MSSYFSGDRVRNQLVRMLPATGRRQWRAVPGSHAGQNYVGRVGYASSGLREFRWEERAMKKSAAWVAILGFLGSVFCVSGVWAQSATKKVPGPEQALQRNWDAIGSKVIAMAEDWPADKYSYRPNDQVRTFGQILVHIAEVNYFAINPAMGKSTKGLQDDPKGYETKEQIVAFVKKSFADGDAVLKAGGNSGALEHLAGWVDIIEHSGEHFGNLVTYYRNNGAVPPESRPKK